MLLVVAFDALVTGMILDTRDNLSNLQKRNLDFPENKVKYVGSERGTRPLITL